jgi:hypothetical protein
MANTVAVERANYNYSPRDAKVAIYDDGVQRPDTTGGNNTIAFGATPDRLYGYDNEISEFGFRKNAVDDNGVHEVGGVGGLIYGYGIHIKFDNGLVYSTSGLAIDGEALQLVGTYQGAGNSSAVAPDSANNRVYFLSGNQLLIYRQDTFTLVERDNLPSSGGSLIRWGDNGLAYRNGNQVYIMTVTENSGPDVSENAALGSAAVALGFHRPAQLDNVVKQARNDGVDMRVAIGGAEGVVAGTVAQMGVNAALLRGSVMAADALDQAMMMELPQWLKS